jgi:hypothetical protein
MSDLSDQPQPGCKVILEDWHPDVEAAIWSDPSPDALRTGIDALAELLTSLVDRPNYASRVTLVLPVDVGKAVMRRDPSVHDAAERGSVSGRTMLRNDGQVEIIVDANSLINVDSSGAFKPSAAGLPSIKPDGLQTLRRVVAHEAQHAIMELQGSGLVAYRYQPNWEGAPNLQFGVARKMCDEHRAEWNAVQVVGAAAPTAGDVLDVVCPMGQQLAAAVERFEQSNREPIDIKRLKDDVYAACDALWSWVAYWAAQYRQGGENSVIGEVPEEIARLEVWQRYVGPTWQTMARALSQLPVALAASPDALHQAARRVAVAVAESLEYIGFRHSESATLNELFRIARHDFPSARE